MWLLDANVPICIAAFLHQHDVTCETALERGWTTLKNGELVSLAVQSGFDCILTRDQYFSQSAMKSLKQYPQMAIVLLKLPQMKEAAYLAAFKETWKTNPIKPRKGSLTGWP